MRHLAFILLLLLSFSANAANYVVAKTGSDSNDGSEANPWLTVQKAAQVVAAGDTVYVLPGTYDERVYCTNNSGASGQPITFQGTNGAIVGEFFLNRGYITVRGFKLQGNSGSDGIVEYMLEAHHGIIESNLFDRVLDNVSALNMAYDEPGGRPYTMTIRFNTFTNCTRTGELNLMGSGHLIASNYFISDSGEDCIRFHASSTRLVGNVFTNWSRPSGSTQHTDLIQAFSTNGEVATNNVIDGNLFINCAGTQVGHIENQAWADSAVHIADWTWRNNVYVNVEAKMSVYAEGIKFYNNTYYKTGINSVGPMYFSYDDAKGHGHNGEVINNIFYECGSVGDGSYDYAVGVTNTVGHHNTVKGISSGTDPVFVNAAANDFRIQVSSPCIGAASTLTGFDYDFAGTTRGSVWDVGAFEYAAGEPIPPAQTNTVNAVFNGGFYINNGRIGN